MALRAEGLSVSEPAFQVIRREGLITSQSSRPQRSEYDKPQG